MNGKLKKDGEAFVSDENMDLDDMLRAIQIGQRLLGEFNDRDVVASRKTFVEQEDYLWGIEVEFTHVPFVFKTTKSITTEEMSALAQPGDAIRQPIHGEIDIGKKIFVKTDSGNYVAQLYGTN